MLNFASNITMMFQEVSFLDRIAAAKDAGFPAVEYLFPYKFPKEEIAKILQNAGMKTVLFNLSAGDWDKGDRGLAAIPTREREFQASVEQAFDYADALDCKQLHVMSGNIQDGATLDCYKQHLREIAPEATNRGITLLIEPLNHRDVPGYLVNKTEEAIEIIDSLGFDNLKLQFDIYHRQITQGDVLTALDDFKDYIHHIQIAGVPYRQEPDNGELNFTSLFEKISRNGYNGWIGCEYTPRTTTTNGLNWLAFARHGKPRGMKDVGLAGVGGGDLIYENGPNESLTLRFVNSKTGDDLCIPLRNAECIRTQYVGPTYRGVITDNNGVEHDDEWLIQYN